MAQQSDVVRGDHAASSKQSPAAEVAELQAALKSEAKDLGKLATALGPLAKSQAFEDVSKLETLIERVAKKVSGLGSGERAQPVLESLREAARLARVRVRERLGPELKDACQTRDLEFRVISREEPIEVRVPPFAVRIHRDKGRAEVMFAKQVIEECAASADAIMKAHETALKRMRSDFDPASFFHACLRGWRAALAAGEVEGSKRVEIVDFLPYLAVQLQDRKFHVEPSDRNYRGYSRARFAFDVNRLREAGGLRQGGWKMSLGVATGTTASQKKRVIFFEDGVGNGEYKLTVNFTRVEGER
jgi:hypothetical protein